MKHTKMKALLLTMSLAGVLILSSCGAGQPAASSDNSQAASTDSQAVASGSPRAAQPIPDVYGEVNAVSGNDITVALLEMPQRPQSSGAGRQRTQDSNNNNQQSPGDSSKPQGSRAQGQGNNGQRQGGGFNIPKKYTGATQTVTVTADTPIMTSVRGTGNTKPTQTNIKITDVKVGSIIQVYYKKGTKDIQNIRVMQIPTAS